MSARDAIRAREQAKGHPSTRPRPEPPVEAPKPKRKPKVEPTAVMDDIVIEEFPDDGLDDG